MSSDAPSETMSNTSARSASSNVERGIQTRNVKTGEESTLACDGVFVSVGRKPSTELVKDQITIDPAGYIIADESTCTNIPGVFAVGDVRTKALRQVVTAVADGATAVHYAEEYLAGEM